MRKLATIQKIVDIQPIPGADSIEVATVLGWKVIVKKDAFKVGELVAFFEVDSLIPRYSWSEFLFKNDDEDYVRLKTIKMRGQISQGLCVPLTEITLRRIWIDWFGSTHLLYEEGDDLTEELGIKKYEVPIPAQLRGKMRGNFPHFIKKTDETRIQSIPRILDLYRKERWYISEKCDGSSLTCYYRNGDFGVCSRNKEYYLDDDNSFSSVAQKLKIKEKLSEYCEENRVNYAIQGELLAPGVRKNKYKKNELTCYFFNVFDIDKGEYLSYNDFVQVIERLGLDTVPILDDDFSLGSMTVDDLVQLSIGESKLAKTQREGIVVRPLEEKRTDYKKLGRVSFKVINPKFLLKHGE